jgi:uncharacterized protein (TIRG00374 family)
VKKRWAGAILAVAALAAILAFIIHRWRTSGFDWHQFASALRNVDWNWLLPGAALVLATYIGRALRWEIMLRPLKKDPKLWQIFTATCIGFTAVVLFGRAGEPVRPYLIAKKEGVSFSSQIAAWIVERILDLLMVLSIFGVALTQVAGSAIQPGPKMRVILEAGGYAVGLAGAGALALLLALRKLRGRPLHKFIGRLKFLPEKPLQKLLTLLESFEEGMQSMRNGSYTALLVFYTIVEWLVIAAAFMCVCRSFPATAALGWTDIVILLGFVAFGSAIQIPGVGGGMQIAAVVVLTEFFGVSFEAASGIALVLWFITFVSIVPLGLAFAFHEGIKFRNLRHLDTKTS